MNKTLTCADALPMQHDASGTPTMKHASNRRRASFALPARTGIGDAIRRRRAEVRSDAHVPLCMPVTSVAQMQAHRETGGRRSALWPAWRRGASITSRIARLRGFACVLLLCLLASCAKANRDSNAVGQQARISIESWIGDSLAGDAARRGRVMLLDCWATWCPECVKSLPHINRIARSYRDRGLDVLCLAVKDKKDNVVRFAEQHPFDAHVAVDRGTQTWDALHVKGIPAVFLIDRDGKIAWQGHPSDVTDTFLDYYLKTGMISVPSEQLRAKPLSVSISLEPAKDCLDNTTAFGQGPGLYLSARSQNPAALISNAIAMMGVPRINIIHAGDPPRYPLMDLVLQADAITPRISAAACFLKYLCSVFSVGHRVRTESVPVHVLSIVDSVKLAAHEVQPWSTTPASVEGRSAAIARFEHVTLANFARLLGNTHKRRVVPEERVADVKLQYSFALAAGNFDAVCLELERTYGVRLVEQMRSVELHTVDYSTFKPPF